jgi:hypothetical protein
MPNATVRANARTLPEDTNETVSPEKEELEEYLGEAFDLAYSKWLLARSDEVRAITKSLDDDAIKHGRQCVLAFSNAERALFTTPAVDSGDLWKKIEAIEFAAVEELASGPLVHSNLLLGLGVLKNDLLAILDPGGREATR